MELYKKYEKQINLILQKAAELHASVNQHYDKDLPYSFHLRLTASYLTKYMDLIPANDDNVQTLYAAAYFHDVLEDTRSSYNDLKKIFASLNDEGCNINIIEAAEIVYALTNDKGRTRHERAGEAYYKGIRETEFAPFMKMCDRLANVRYSSLFFPPQKMLDVYREETPQFLKAISDGAKTPVPQAMVDELNKMLGL